MPMLIGALSASLIVYLLYNLAPIPFSFWQRRFEKATTPREEEELPFLRAMLLSLGSALRRFAPAHWVVTTKSDLYWAQRGGAWQGWSETEFLGLRVALGLAGVAGGFAIGAALWQALGMGVLLFMYPGITLSSAAERARRRFLRELPEAAQLLSLLTAIGLGLREALVRLGEGESMVAAWMRETVALSGGRLFTPAGATKEEMGTLRRRALESGLPALVELAVQLDLIYQKGGETKELLDSVADTVSANYYAEVERRAEELENKLIVPTVVFYFLPFVALMLAPVVQGLLSLIAG